MELTVDETKGIAYIRLSGLLSEEVILSAFDAAVADERYRSGMGRLWDFREADLSALDTLTIVAMAKHSTRFSAGINDVKVSFVVGRDLEYGLTRMFQAFSGDAETDVAVFLSMEEAEAWMTE